MRYLSIIMVLAFFATMLEASYYRSVRVVAHPKESDALKAAKKLENFIATQQNIVEFQQTIGFSVKVVKAGKYYMVVMESFTDEIKELQEIIDTLRDKYPNVYVKKIKAKTPPKNKIKKSEPAQKPVLVEVKTVSKAVKKEETPLNNTIKATPVITKKVETKEVKKEEVNSATLPLVVEPIVEVVEMQEVVFEKSIPKNISSLKQEQNVSSVQKEIKSDINNSQVQEQLAQEKLTSAIVIAEEPKEVVEKVIKESEVENINIEKNETAIVVVHDEERLNSEEEQGDILLSLYDNILILWQALFGVTFLVLLIMYKKYSSYKNRNDELVEQEIIDSEKLELVSLELKNRDRYIAHISQEIRQPIESILNATTQVKENNVIVPRNDLVEKLEASAQHLWAILNDISDLKAIGEGSLELKKEEFNINDVLKNVLNIVAIGAKNNNIALSLDVAKNVPSHVVGDAQRLEHILINVFENAVKQTKAGSIHLNLTQNTDDDDIVTLSFTLKDSGRGMSAIEVENAFKIYNQDEAGTIGLGLYISKKLVEMMHGQITIQSEENIGTLLSFDVKVALRDPQERRHYRLASEDYLHKNILLVESSDSKLASLKKAFEYFNYTVLSMPSFEESIDLSEISVDLMIVNQYKLTDLAIESIKNTQANSSCKVIILGDIYTPINETILEGLKIDAFLTAPLVQQAVYEVITKVCTQESLYSKYLKENQELEIANNEFQKQDDVLIEEETTTEFSGDESVFVDDTEEALEEKVTESVIAHVAEPFEITEVVSASEEAVEELSVEVGIANCDNDENFYNTMLQEFKNAYENSPVIIEGLCESNDFDKARYYSMDIKDLAINIGAYKLCESVAAMEYEFEKGQESDWSNYISAYAQHLEALLVAIDKQLTK